MCHIKKFPKMSSSESILLNNSEKKEHLKSLYHHLCTGSKSIENVDDENQTASRSFSENVTANATRKIMVSMVLVPYGINPYFDIVPR
ncbi:hypothetical protein BpHYR1_010233, partial [Brachionus plicatilis]